MNEEVTIDIKELGRRIIKKWKGLVIAGVIGAFAMSAVGYGISYNKYMDGQPVSESELETYKANLTQKEQEKVVQAYETYEVCKKQYQSDLEYNQNSILMKLGTDNANTVELQYYIDNGYKSVYPVIEQTNNAADIIAEYSLYLTSDDVVEKIKEKTGIDIANWYLKELINVEALENTQTMKISICADSEELVNGMADVIEQEVENYESQLQSKYGDFQALSSDRHESSTLDETVFELQQTKITAIATLESQMSTIGANLTAEQNVYYSALIKNDEQVDEEFKGEIISKKYMAIGCGLGIIVLAGWIVIKYLMQKQIRNYTDIQDLYQIYTFDVINEKKIESMGSVVQQIVACATANGIHKIGLIGTDTSEKSQKVLQKLEKELKNKQLEIVSGLGVENISIVLQKIGNAGHVIMIETKNGSFYTDIEKEIAICEKCNIDILGNVLVDSI